MGLHKSCAKTKLQNVAYGQPPLSVDIDGEHVEAVQSLPTWALKCHLLGTVHLTSIDASAWLIPIWANLTEYGTIVVLAWRPSCAYTIAAY